MSDTDGTPKADGATPPENSAAATEQAKPPIVINAQYVKDLSFEAPAAPGIFSKMQQTKPEMGIKVDVQARQLDGQTFEVVLHIEAECKADDQTAFMLDLIYGGVFTLNLAAKDVRPVLLIECPRLLFPFARQIIASATLDGGFLPLMLGPVDFASLYRRQLAEQQQEGSGAAEEGAEGTN